MGSAVSQSLQGACAANERLARAGSAGCSPSLGHCGIRQCWWLVPGVCLQVGSLFTVLQCDIFAACSVVHHAGRHAHGVFVVV